MKVWLVTLAACGSSDGVGTVAYSDPNGQIAMVDVASGVVTPLDPGVFGGVSISPDGRYVAYLGNDGVPKMNDLNGTITNLPASTSGIGPLLWVGQTLSYGVFDPNTGIQATQFLAHPGATPRLLNGAVVAVSRDGAHVAFIDPFTAKLSLENADGSNRVDVSMNAGSPISFSDDGSFLIFPASNASREEVHRFDVASGTDLVLGAGNTLQPLAGTSTVSPDGKEVLADDGTNAMVGYEQDGSKRIYINGRGPNGFVQAAGYLDNGLVVAGFGALVQITDGASPKTLASSDHSQCFPLLVSRQVHQIMLECSAAAIVDFSGELVSSRAVPTPIGMSSDGAGLISLDVNGVLEITTPSGTRTLAQTMSQNNAFVSPPFASYAALTDP